MKAAGDEPFGSVLVDADGTVIAEERNRERSTGDPARHPEFALARWAATNLAAGARAAGPVPDLAEQAHESHRRFRGGQD
jgi:tRNA(Arg) A34 adenosine deaminase TadA